MLAARPAPGWPGGPARRRDRCLLLFGFAGALRRSEACALDIADVAYHPADGLHITLTASKTDQAGRGAVIALPFGSHPLTCPVRAYLAWLEVLDRHAGGGTPAVRALLEPRAGDEAVAERRHRDHNQAARLADHPPGPLFRPINRQGHLAAAMSGAACTTCCAATPPAPACPPATTAATRCAPASPPPRPAPAPPTGRSCAKADGAPTPPSTATSACPIRSTTTSSPDSASNS